MSQVTLINRSPFEIVLPTDTVKDGKLIKTPISFTRTKRDGTIVQGKDSLIVLDGMLRGEIKPHPVVIDKSEWDRIAKLKAVAGYVAEGKIEVR
jgi:hypothetical protein